MEHKKNDVSVFKRAVAGLLSLMLLLGTFAGVSGTALALENEKFELLGSSMTLGNTLQINFAIDTTLLTGDDNYVVITKEYADERGIVSKTIAQADWTAQSASVSYVSYAVTAKEMNDQLTVTVYNAAGEQLSNVYTDSVAAYCVRNLGKEEEKSAPEARKLALYVDMLNYGAAAQEEWSYNLDALANAELTEAQQAYATQIEAVENILEKGEGYYGTSLSLKENILLNVAYNADEVAEAKYAQVSFVDHYGNDESVTVPAEDFKSSGSIVYVEITAMAVADYAQPVTVCLYNEADEVISTTVDSVGSYISRQEGALYDAILAFGMSAHKYFHSENAPSQGENMVEISTSVSVENGQVSEDASLSEGDISAQIPAGVQVEGETLTLTVTEKSESDSGVALEEGQEILPLDIHIEGVSAQNATPIQVCLGKILPNGLNIGNITLYHVENGVSNEMIRVMTLAELDEHNEFYYDPATGDITVAMASFSEIAMVAEEEKAWEGNFDEFTGKGTEEDPYIIANADQLAKMSKLVSEDETYASAHYKLVSNVNLNGKKAQAEDKKGLVFYPIGYWKQQTGTNSADENYFDYGNAFTGIFDGNGHTIGNIYQNTWLMDGNYDNGYWDAAMGLFGYVYEGTVKNLTVDNFSSDGEYTPTGCVAAYAAKSTFENIAITNCNPRVYNTGNGGIIGIAGNSGEQGNKILLKNITVDNSNKISALWGSWDVACGGLVGMFRGNVSGGTGEIHFENCHVSAQIDVNNDVCANYQYYAYRYSGMLIGSVRENVTIDGHVYPKMDGITAEGCTVHFGTWNDYYYCELVANSLASYTHDHQFSRLVEIKAIDGTTITYLDGTTGTVPASGRANYVIVDYAKGHGTGNATCYHFVDGKVHNHDDYNGDGTPDKETVNGQEIFVENNRHIYLEFNNLITGYGWGVTTKAVGDMDGVKILDREVANSVEKFKGKNVDKIENKKEIKLSDLFDRINTEVELKHDALTVTVTDLDETDGIATGTFTKKATWEESTISIEGTGNISITIQDYYFCTPTTINVTVTEREAAEKFETKFTGDFLYRVGNDDNTPVKLGSMFKAKDGVEIGKVSITIEPVDDTGASGKYTEKTTWTDGAIDFDGTGIVKVTINDDDTYCKPTELYLEVVDAVNTTGAADAIANNVVLLNDCGFSSLEVSGGYTLYGNGFTLTCGSDSPVLDFGYSFVTLNNGTLDNVQIVCPNFDYAALYKDNLTSSANRSQTTDRTRYYNAKSGIMVSGNSQILNSRISGARAAVNVSGGNCLIDNSRIELGAVASLLIGAANSVTLRDVTLVQKPTASTYDASKILVGFSVLFICDNNGNAAPVTLEGTLVQNAWVDENDKQYVPSAGQSIVSAVLGKTDYLHDLDGDGKNESLNLGFAYMPEEFNSRVNDPTITDNRTNQTVAPYEKTGVATTWVYSYKNTSGTADSFKNESVYVPNKYSDNITVTYSDTADGLTTGKSFENSNWVYELNVDLDKIPGYALDFSKLSMAINGAPVTDYKVNGNAKPTAPVAVTAGGVTYTLTATVNGKEYTAYYKVTGTETSKESPSLVAANYEAGLCVASSYGGTWSGAAPALKGIQIKYWSVAEKQYKTINLADYTPTTKGKLNGNNTTWTYSPANGDFTLTLTGGQVHSSNKVNAMPVVCDGVLYFVAAASNGLVNSGNSARSVPVSYTFKDNNNGDVLSFSHTWSVAENKDAQYKYSDFCNGTLTLLEDEGCLVEGTMITLADGTQKAIEDVAIGDMVLAFNHVSGKFEATPIIFNTHFSQEANEYDVLHLEFANGEELKIVQSHGLFDMTLMQYVYVDYENYADFIGHEFYYAGNDGSATENVVLENAYIEKENTRIFCPVSYFHMSSISNGFLNTPNIPGKITGLVNYFEYDPDLKYNEEAMQRDIEKYGLYTYEDFSDYISEAAYNSSPAVFLKVAVGKGMITYEQILDVIEYLLAGSLID